MSKPRVPPAIAVDGPAGAGKSTLARALARSLKFRHVDTGAMYRAAAWSVLRAGISPDDPRRVPPLVRRLRIRFTEGEPARVLADGRDVTDLLRSPDVSQAASRLATLAPARRILVAAQRRLAREGGVVMEGRDIGTVVLPRAAVKFFLDASVEERARRRWREDRRLPLGAIARSIRERDLRDRSRAASPLRPADDAVVVDTTGYSPRQVLLILKGWVRRKARSA